MLKYNRKRYIKDMLNSEVVNLAGAANVLELFLL